ncbi:hypothetical protein N9N89_01625 [Gammaproteobacteria bacterium]|nr:hypothetical protein [Gammaproteobacteria bacterium]
MKKNPIFSFIWVTILFNYKDYQIKVRNGMWNAVEEIWVNDELKHRQASWKWRTQNSIELSNGETLDFDFGYEKLKGKRFSISKGISLYVKSGDNEIYRLEPEKEIIGWKGLIACLIIGFLFGFYVLPLIFG